MSGQNKNLRDGIICVILWILCAIAMVAVWNQCGWKLALAALLPIMFFADLLIWFIFSLLRLPCGFTEWVCYPFWPCIPSGLPMRIGVLIRLVEIATLLISGHWLWETVKALV